uniref:Uncharacterized protein n=1 Tax=Cyanoderma ruficeps TaxID=181631 RepID=A0A8C3QMI0_9PASS
TENAPERRGKELQESLCPWAVQAGAASISGLLLSKGMDTNVRNQAEETPPHIAAFQNNGALIGLLVTAGARINAVTKYFVTALHVASQRGHADAARQLLHHEAHVNAQDKQAKCPLHLAAEQGDKTLAEMLLKARADPNAQDKEKTPLQAAALRGHLSAVEVLLANRAGAKDTDGWSPLHYATTRGNTDIAKVLPKRLEEDSPAYCSGVRTRRVGKSPCRMSVFPQGIPETTTIINNYFSFYLFSYHCLDFAFLNRENKNHRICHLLISLSFQHKDNMCRIKRLQKSFLRHFLSQQKVLWGYFPNDNQPLHFPSDYKPSYHKHPNTF